MSEKDHNISDTNNQISVNEAAELLGVAYNTALGYVHDGKLKSIRISGVHLIPREEIENFKRGMAGRPRTSVPKWRFSPEGNELIGTSVEVELRAGVSEKDFVRALDKVRRDKNLLFEGTIARYVLSNRREPRRVQFLLLWRQTVMPPEDEIEKALAALRGVLSGVLDWSTASSSTQQVWMHT